MRLLINIVALLAISSVYTYTIPENKEMVKREDDSDNVYVGINPVFPVKKECNEAYKQLDQENEECTANYYNEHKTNLDEICTKFNSEKCQKYYQIKVADLSECKDTSKSSLDVVDNLRKISYLGLKNSCAKDENNNYCPLNEFKLLKDKNNMSKKEEEKLYLKAKEDTCRSKLCSDVYVECMGGIIELRNEYAKAEAEAVKEKDSTVTLKYSSEETNPTLDYFTSKSCIAQHSISGVENVFNNINLYIILSLISTLYLFF